MPAKLSDFTVVDTIGSGTFGICKRIRRNEDGKQLVWKELDYGQMSPREKEMLVSEVNILRDLRHPNIVRYYDRIIDRDNTRIYIVMEYCPGGDLGAMIRRARRERRHVDESLIWKMFAQILWAVQDCHNKTGGAVLHRDLKPANVFLDKSGNVKIGDFGLARVLSSTQMYARTFVGTPYYMSPEQLNEQKYNEKSDIWSLGCLIYELAALVPPFDAANQAELRKKVNIGMFKKLPSSFSEDLNTTIKLMLQRDVHARPSTQDILTRGIAKGRILPSDRPQVRRRFDVAAAGAGAGVGAAVGASPPEPAPSTAVVERVERRGGPGGATDRRATATATEARRTPLGMPPTRAAGSGERRATPVGMERGRGVAFPRTDTATATESQLRAREDALRAREQQLLDREMDLDRRESSLLMRERRVAEQEKAYTTQRRVSKPFLQVNRPLGYDRKA